MSKKEINYTDEPIGTIKMVKDFLPTPDELVLKEETVKVTLSLTRDSVDFFKNFADKNHTHYQTMIRELVDKYAEYYRDSA